MKKISKGLLAKLIFLFFIFIVVVIYSCHKDLSNKNSVTGNLILQNNHIDIGKLQAAYRTGISNSSKKVSDLSDQAIADMVGTLNVDWSSYTLQEFADSTEIIEFAMPDDTSLYAVADTAANDTTYHNKTNAVFILHNDTLQMSFFMKTMENPTDSSYVSVIDQLHYLQVPQTFNGQILYFTLNRQFINGYGWQKGNLNSTLSFCSNYQPPVTNQNLHHKHISEVSPVSYCLTAIVYEKNDSPVVGSNANTASYQGSNWTPVNTLSACTVDYGDDPTSSGGGSSATGANSGGGGGVAGGTTPTQKCASTTAQSVHGKVVDAVSGCTVTSPSAPTTVILSEPQDDQDFDDNTSVGGYDTNTYPAYQNTTPWPTIPNVINVKSFIPYDGRNCLLIGEDQIAVNNYQISDYDAPGQTIQVYTEKSGYNLGNSKKAVAYLIYALSHKIPVMVGVDVFTSIGNYKVTKVNLKTDASTDHFIEIVAMGTDSKGNYFQFFDNSTIYQNLGTSTLNKLYYDAKTGAITGNTQSPYDNAAAQSAHPYKHPYIITQIRKSKLIK